jgi:hypothetical protein
MQTFMQGDNAMAEQFSIRSVKQAKDGRSYSELLVAVMDVGWLPVHTAYGSQDALVTFEALNIVGATATGTRTAGGRDEDDALRNFLSELGVPDERTEDELQSAVLGAG